MKTDPEACAAAITEQIKAGEEITPIVLAEIARFSAARDNLWKQLNRAEAKQQLEAFRPTKHRWDNEKRKRNRDDAARIATRLREELGLI